MLRSSLCIIALLSLGSLFGQLPLVSIPGHQLKQGTPPGTVVSTRITNTGSKPATFLFAYPVKSDERHFATAQSHTSWLLKQVKKGMDTVQAQLALIKAEAGFRRSRFFTNWGKPMSAYMADVPDSAFARMYGNTSTGWYYTSGQESFVQFYTNLIETGYFKPSQFRMVDLIKQSMGEVMVNGQWIFVDVNVSSIVTPLTNNKASANGYASAEAIKANRMLLQPYKWGYPGGPDSLAAAQPLSLNTIETYRKNFDSVSYLNIQWQPCYRHDGVVILPPGASLIWADTIGRLRDFSQPGVKDTIKELTKLLTGFKGKQQSTLDSVNGLLKVVDLTLNDLKNTNDPRTVFFFTGRQAYVSLAWSHPMLTIATTGNTDYVVGKDIKYPGFISSVKGTVQFADTTLSNTTVKLWSKMNEPQSSIAYKSLHFLDGEGKVLAGSAVTLSYNPMLGANFYNGVQIDQLDEPDSLTIEMQVNNKVTYTSSTGR